MSKPAAKPLGDCIDCRACVNVCPTGVDIRDGVQLGCINCGLCVDACNEMMDKTGQARWLIKWDTFAHQEARAEGKAAASYNLLRPRTLIYVTALLLGFGIMGFAMATRPLMEFAIQHDRAPLFVTVRDGSLRNAYTVKVSNKTPVAADFEVSLKGLEDGGMTVAEEGETRATSLTLHVPADSVGTFRVLLFGHPAHLTDGSQDVVLTARNTGTGELKAYKTVFMGPGAPAR
jgi:cytochrome c oxidase accessory protein FixG